MLEASLSIFAPQIRSSHHKSMSDKKLEAKALLARAGVELNNTLKRVDSMSDTEVADTIKSVENLKAFFDKNGSCGAATLRDLAAFFDKNGSCSMHRSPAIENALKNVLK
jgi:hypothetical protein